MGGAARNHGGTRGHGCSPLLGERPNVNRHTLSDSTIIKMVKSKKVSPEKQPTDRKLMIVKQLPRVERDWALQEKLNTISKVIDKKQVSQDVQIGKKIDSIGVENTKAPGSIHQLKQAKFKANSPPQNTHLERLDDTNLQLVNSKSLEAEKSEPWIKVENKQCNQENKTQVPRVAEGSPKQMNGKTNKLQAGDLPSKMPKFSTKTNQQQIDDKVIPQLDTKHVQQVNKEQKLPDQHLLHVDTTTLQQEVEKHPGYLAVPQPLDSLPAIQTLRHQVWIDNCLMQPTMISYPTFPVPVSTCQVPSGLLLIQLSPVMFTLTPINQAHPPPEAYMTSMPEQD